MEMEKREQGTRPSRVKYGWVEATSGSPGDQNKKCYSRSLGARYHLRSPRNQYTTLSSSSLTVTNPVSCTTLFVPARRHTNPSSYSCLITSITSTRSYTDRNRHTISACYHTPSIRIYLATCVRSVTYLRDTWPKHNSADHCSQCSTPRVPHFSACGVEPSPWEHIYSRLFTDRNRPSTGMVGRHNQYSGVTHENDERYRIVHQRGQCG